MTPAPLILTLAFDPATFARLDAMRRAHFPPERNVIPAHLTLFHHLPGAEEAAIASRLAAAGSATPAFPLRFTGLRFLGRGVAIEVAAPPLLALRAGLAEAWRDRLTPQDRQGFRPHVTVQNKAAPDEARALFDRLSAGFEPFAGEAAGLLLWRYLGGPWERLGFRRFGADGGRADAPGG